MNGNEQKGSRFIFIAFTTYDALDRVTEVKQNSEHDATLGLLTTRTDYLDGFRTQVTNPRGYTSITSYKAYDQPTTDWPTAIAYPSIGAYVDIERDVYGKPLSLTRRNSSSTLATTRTYLYGGAQRLCVVTEPETGSTVSVFDGRDNLLWSASGLTIPSGTSCADAKAQASASGRVVNRTYDARNRIRTLTFPTTDGRGNQEWTYTPDGLPDQVTAHNAAGNAQPVTTDYTYNRRRLLTQERLLERNWALTYYYNANGHLSSHVLPGGEVVTHAPNALGQATKVSGSMGGDFATDVTYHPDGAIRTFTYGNGISHALGRNVRGLPYLNQDFYVDTAGATVKILKDEYDYDQNGNVLAITDWRSQRGDRDMSYDSLDRLKTVTSDMFGTQGASYTYDILDNLTRVNIGGTKARDHFYCYDSRRRLTSVRTVGCPTGSGTTVIGLDYDEQGNLENKNGQLFDFDFGNRLREGTDADDLAKKETYQYDAHGRRVLASASNGDIRSQYGQDGVLHYQQDDRVGKAFNYFYLGGRLVAVRETPLGTTNHTIKFQHTDALGSPMAVTAANRAVLERSEYEPYGSLLNRPLKDGPGYTGHVLDAATGLNYMQQRYYWPEGGRFLSVDPVTADGNTGANFNRYWYANNNPYRFTDPDGRQSKEDNGNFWVGVAKAVHDTIAPIAHAIVDPSGTNIDPSSDRMGPGPGQVEQGGYKFGSALMVAEGAKGMGQLAGGFAKGETAVALTGAQAKNLARFEGKLPAANTGTTVTQTGKGVTFTSEVPGRVPGSKAVYEKAVDGAGTTTGYKKTTVDPNGQVVHVKDKLN